MKKQFLFFVVTVMSVLSLSELFADESRPIHSIARIQFAHQRDNGELIAGQASLYNRPEGHIEINYVITEHDMVMPRQEDMKTLRAPIGEASLSQMEELAKDLSWVEIVHHEAAQICMMMPRVVDLYDSLMVRVYDADQGRFGDEIRPTLSPMGCWAKQTYFPSNEGGRIMAHRLKGILKAHALSAIDWYDHMAQ